MGDYEKILYSWKKGDGWREMVMRSLKNYFEGKDFACLKDTKPSCIELNCSSN